MNPPKCECHSCTQSRIHPMERGQFQKQVNSVCISREEIIKAYEEIMNKSPQEAGYYYFIKFHLSEQFKQVYSQRE